MYFIRDAGKPVTAATIGECVYFGALRGGASVPSLLALMNGVYVSSLLHDPSFPDAVRRDLTGQLHKFMANLTETRCAELTVETIEQWRCCDVRGWPGLATGSNARQSAFTLLNTVPLCPDLSTLMVTCPLPHLRAARYEVEGRTVLYIPRQTLPHPFEAVSDKDLVHRLESTILHWTRQIKETLHRQVRRVAARWPEALTSGLSCARAAPALVAMHPPPVVSPSRHSCFAQSVTLSRACHRLAI